MPKEKLTQEFIENYMLERGCVLTSIYMNSKAPIEYICKCGNSAITTYSNFKKGQLCMKCRGSVLHSQDYINNYFKKYNCECLDTYVKNDSLLKFKCGCGNIDYKSYATFKKSPKCKSCGLLLRSGENHHKWNPDRNKIKLKIKIHAKCLGMLRKCIKKYNLIKLSKSEKMLGFTREQLLKHLESFSEWNNLKLDTWHLDHIFPIKAFIDFGITDLKVINSLDNLQPLSKHDNLSKRDKYNKNEFKKYLQLKNIYIT